MDEKEWNDLWREREKQWIKKLEKNIEGFKFVPKSIVEEWKHIPQKEEEKNFIKVVKGHLPYYVCTYGAALLKAVPGVGTWLSKAFSAVVKWKLSADFEQKEIIK